MFQSKDNYLIHLIMNHLFSTHKNSETCFVKCGVSKKHYAQTLNTMTNTERQFNTLTNKEHTLKAKQTWDISFKTTAYKVTLELALSLV